MLFNSLEFLLFLPIVFGIYWLLRDKLRWQNLFVVVASYVFYGWWDWRFLLLIAFTSFCSFLSGSMLAKPAGGNVDCRLKNDDEGLPSSENERVRRRRKWITGTNIVVNLAILGMFKYYNFFVESFAELMGAVGWHVDYVTLNVILPVGISFYTFQALSYSIDVYRRKIEPTNDVVAFFAYIAFFPQLVAGPIERAANLLPQMLRPRTFDYRNAVEGSKLILWGFFKKIAIADTASGIVTSIYGDIGTYNATALWIGAILFTFQIYGDFSGYSDIAIGTARLFGVDLKKNFNLPYFSRNIAEFWKRWHISLNTWFVDYVYIPLGGSRVSKAITVRNTFVIFLVSGLWHGANWTFVCWGLYHALLFVPLLLLGKQKKFGEFDNKIRFSMKEIGGIFCTFILVVFGWVLFRAETIAEAGQYIAGMLDVKSLGVPNINPKRLLVILECMIAIVVMLTIEYRRRGQDVVLNFHSRVKALNWAGYLAIAVWAWMFFAVGQTFIYFQF